jgi:hypothetical protein
MADSFRLRLVTPRRRKDRGGQLPQPVMLNLHGLAPSLAPTQKCFTAFLRPGNGGPWPEISKSVERHQNHPREEATNEAHHAVSGKRPGVLVSHEWYDHNQYCRHRAEQLAKLGYVAFALG